MSNEQKIKAFILKRIHEIDQEYHLTADVMVKLKLATMRTSFSNIMKSYFEEQRQVATSYYLYAITYMQAERYEQAIQKAQLAKKHTPTDALLEQINITILKCLAQNHETLDQAEQYLQQFNPIQLKEQYYRTKTQIMQKLKKQTETTSALQELQHIVTLKYQEISIEKGLFMIQKGRVHHCFENYKEALKHLSQGMNILIELQYQDHFQVGKIYLTIASTNRKLGDLDSEYSALICAHSMIKQNTDQHKQLIDVLQKIAKNQEERGEDQNALAELMKVECLEKQIYGESTLIVSKTLKKIINILSRLNRKNQLKRYEQEYLRIVDSNDKKQCIEHTKEQRLKTSNVKVK